MSFFRCGLTFVSALIVTFLVLGSFRVSAIGETGADAEVTIRDAKNTIFDCYGAVLEAEKAGANVTVLLTVLDEAGMLLSRANLAYEMGDYDSAVYFANQSLVKLNGLVAEADDLRETALQQRYWDFMVNVVGSSVGTAGVVCVGFAVWFFMEKREKSRGHVNES